MSSSVHFLASFGDDILISAEQSYIVASWNNSRLDLPEEIVVSEKGQWIQGPGFSSVTLAAWSKPSPEFPLLFMQPWAINELQLCGYPTDHFASLPDIQWFQG